MRIAHTADIHIRGLHYHDEIEYTFQRFYESLRKKKPDLIYIGGDLYHSKLTVTSEYFTICRKFLKNLRDIATVIVIPGNHDLALNNLSRTDAISPIVESLNDSSKTTELIYSKTTEKISLYNGRGKKFNFYHLSCLDQKEEWNKIKEKIDPEEINIALYHGSINGCVVDNGWVSRGNKDNISLFDEFDYALLGDIHKHQFMTPKIAYPGSIRQNNYGEDIDKGYILWEISGKNNFSSKFIQLPQKRYFFTLHTDSAENIQDDLQLPENSRIQVKATKSLSISEEVKIKNKVKRLYKPRNDVPVLAPEESFNIGKLKFGDNLEIDNVRSPEIQKTLIKEYFKNNKNVSLEDLEEVIKLDKTYHSYIDTDVLRNVLWNIEEFEWENLFCFGEGNKIDFSKIGGLIGVFGKNRTGKSSVFEALNYTIQNKINKEGANKNVDFVNSRKGKGSGAVKLSLNNKKYKIERTTERKVTKKGEEKSINEISFVRLMDKNKVKSLDGETKTDTNKNIRNKFGTLEDFNTVSSVFQFGLTNIIDAKATKRKEVLNKFLDLGIFDEKCRLANEDAKKIREMLSPHLDRDYDEELRKLKKEEKSYKKAIKLNTKEKDKQEEALENLNNNISSIQSKIKEVSFNEYDLEDLEKTVSSLRGQKDGLEANKKDFEDRISTLEGLLSKDFESESKVSDYLSFLNEEDKKNEHLKRKLKTAELLKTIPDVIECRICPLAIDAYGAEEEAKEIEGQIEKKVVPEDFEKAKKELELYKKIRQNKFELVNLQLKIKDIEEDLYDAEEKLNEAKSFTETIISNATYEKELKKLLSEKEILKNSISTLNSDIVSFSKQLGSITEKIDQTKENNKVAEELKKQYHTYQLYLDAMGKDGIAYMIMSQKLPIINKQVNYILSQVMPFQCTIEEDMQERSIKIYLHDKKGKYIIELGSGAEKTVTALALRAALWNISSLPKSPILILDEPFGYLDDESYDSVLKLLSHLKTYFKHIFVISHNEDIKVAMDHMIYIEQNEEEFSKIKA